MPAAVHGILEELGRRLRERRLARGSSLAELARRADVSRRYLTDAEAGRANPSLLVLARLARALSVPMRELVDLPLGPRGERLALVGLRGAGKSTVGARLARRLEAPFVELDERVERAAGLSLGEIFDLSGPEGFHQLESEALEAVLAEGERQVLATGGSIVASADNFDRLRATCRTIWLRAAPEAHMERVQSQGDSRPMADRPRAMEELRALLARREPAYALCDAVVDTDGRTPEEVAEAVLAAAGTPLER